MLCRLLPLPDPMRCRLVSVFATACLSLAVSTFTLAENFPRPAALQPAVDFWTRVYTEVDTRSGYMHDADSVGVIYETLSLSGDYYADKRAMRAAKARYRKILEALAADRSNPSPEARRVLALWGPDVSDERLREAARSVRFQRGQSDRFKAGIIRSGEWNDHIEQVLRERGLPLELGVLPHVESSFNPAAYSKVGAAGIWQFTRSTGRRYLEVDYVIDERMDPFAATVAAAQLLEHNHQLTGTWPLALTAYNHGAASMRRATTELGTTDIETIIEKYNGRRFGFASRNFYPSFLAALEVSSNRDKYFGTLQLTPPVPYLEVELSEFIGAEDIARALEVDLGVLKQHNRALLDPIWQGNKRIPAGFTLRVPRDRLGADPQLVLASIPDDKRFDEQTPDLYHTVVRGDTVSEIARRYGHSIRDVAAMNGLNRRYTIRVGQVLRLPYEGDPALLAMAGEAAGQAVEEAPVIEVDSARETLPGEPLPQDALADAETPAQSIEGPPPEETMLSAMADEEAAPALELLADPSDYTVADNNSIEVQAMETLGHYAEWLDLRASQLRRINGRRYGVPLVIGQRLKLDFSRVSPEEFERRRVAYQKDIQQAFFMARQIQGTRKHVVKQGDSLWELTHQRYEVPMWLLRQYNPELDPDRLQLGMVLVVPMLKDA